MITRLDDALLRNFGYRYFKTTRPTTVCDRIDFVVERFTGGDVLDVGCGSAGVYVALAGQPAPELRRYLGIDWNVARLRGRVRNGELRLVDLRQADEIDTGIFDFVVCTEVIEHLNDDSQLMRLLARSCRPGGTLLLTTPSREFVHHFKDDYPEFFVPVTGVEDGGHVRDGYTPDELSTLAEEAGFRAEEIVPISKFTTASLGAYLQIARRNQYARVVRNLFHRSPSHDGLGWSLGLVATRI